MSGGLVSVIIALIIAAILDRNGIVVCAILLWVIGTPIAYLLLLTPKFSIMMGEYLGIPKWFVIALWVIVGYVVIYMYQIIKNPSDEE